MLNGPLLGLRINAQHRMDDALGIWKARGKGADRVHENFDGWQIRKTSQGWTVHRPDGTPADKWTWSTLAVAKAAAARLMASE